MNYVNIVERLERALPEMRDDECWIPEFTPSQNGYNLIKEERPSRQCRVVHRLAWEMHNAEPIPEGKVIMHTCDNRACCNPEHLVLGTQLDNIADMVAKGRHKRGPEPQNRRLTDEQVEIIRSFKADGIRVIDMANELGLNKTTIYNYLK